MERHGDEVIARLREPAASLTGSHGAPDGRNPSYLTTISPVMDGWIVQWYGNVPALENWCE